MNDGAEFLVYKRFWAVLLSVVPGLIAMVGGFILTLYLTADVAGLSWGLGIGLSAAVLFLGFFAAVGLGMTVQRAMLPRDRFGE